MKPPQPWIMENFCHLSNFTLIVDKFGIKYEGIENAQNLINVIKNNYELYVDWSGSIYCEIHLNKNYDEGHVDIYMTTYVSEQSKNMHIIKNHP